MAVTPVNSEDRLVQATFAEHLERVLDWDSVYAWNQEIFGPDGTLGRSDTKDALLTRDLRAALERLNPDLPVSAIEDALRALTEYNVSRSMLQHNRDFYRLLRGGVPVEYRDTQGHRKSARARVIDFDNALGSNRFLAVRELTLTGIRTPNYNRRADLVCFINGLPLVFIELKAVHKNIREDRSALPRGQRDPATLPGTSRVGDGPSSTLGSGVATRWLYSIEQPDVWRLGFPLISHPGIPI